MSTIPTFVKDYSEWKNRFLFRCREEVLKSIDLLRVGSFRGRKDLKTYTRMLNDLLEKSRRKSWRNEARALLKMGGVSDFFVWDTFIKARTDNIIIRGRDLGQFNVALGITSINMPLDTENCISVRRASASAPRHPHVYWRGVVCFGNMAYAVKELIEMCEIPVVFSCVVQYLNTYNEHSPIVRLEDCFMGE